MTFIGKSHVILELEPAVTFVIYASSCANKQI